MSIQPLDQVEIASERPSEYFKHKENFQTLLRLFVEKVQEVEDALIDLSDQKDLDTVTGVWLDYIGKIVGLDRNGLNDDDYRKALQLKIGINNSDGTPEIISELMQTYTKSDRVRIAEHRLSWGQMMVNGEENVDASAFAMLEQIRPVAIRMFLLKFTDRTFFPNWEIEIPIPELFEVFTGGVTEPLEVVLDSMGSVSTLFVNTTSASNNVVKNKLGVPYFGWEKPNLFEVFNGTTVEPFFVQLTPTVSEQLQVEGVGKSSGQGITWAWEINENSNG